MKKFTKIATSIVAGCALVGVTTGGAILLNDDDKDIIINVIPQEEPQEPEIPVEGDENPEDIPQETPIEETPSEEEPEETPSEKEDKEETSPENSTPDPQYEPQEESQEDDSLQPLITEYGYITVEVRIYNRQSGVYSKSDILNFEGEGSISVYNLYEEIKAEYPSRKQCSEPSESLNTYLKYSNDSTVDLIVHFK